jgi:Flp pilus assembly protein CpaB
VSRRARIGILIAIVGVALAAVGIFFLSQVVQQSIAPPAAPTPLPPVTESIVVAARDLPKGNVLQASDVRLVEYPVEVIPLNAIRNPELVVGRFTHVPLVSGEMVLEHHLADPTNVSGDIGYVIGQDQVLMAFPASDLMSSLSILKRGDLVDLLVSIEQPVRIVDETGRQLLGAEGQPLVENRFLTLDAMQRVEISGMIVDIIESEDNQRTVQGTVTDGTPQPAPTPPPSEIRIRAYLLALDPQDALLVKYLLDSGAIFDLVLRNPTSEEIFDLEPVMPEYLIDKYQLEIPR